MLEVKDLRVDLPVWGCGVADVGLTVARGQVCGVVGRTASGSSLLVGALAHHLPPGARWSGDVHLDGQPWDRIGPRHRRVLRVGQPAPLLVADVLARLSTNVREVAESAGLTTHLRRRATTLPPDARAHLQLAVLELSPSCDVLLLDDDLTGADSPTRQRTAAAVRRHAERGAAVVWASHDLDTLWPVADTIVELPGPTREVPLAGWIPATLPLPSAALPPAHRPETRSIRHSPRPHDEAPIVLDPRAVGLMGAPVELQPSECLGVVDLAERPEPLARALVTHLGGHVVPSRLGPRHSAGRAAATWWTSVGSPEGDLAGVPADRPVARLSRGELARLRHALALQVERPIWLPHAQAGLDPVDRDGLARRLSGPNPGLRIITTPDLGFLRQAAHRLLVVSGRRVVAVGSPSAVADLLTPHEALA